MGTIFTILGIVAALFIIKFIYDSYLTNNTNSEWEKFKSINPEKAARLENNSGLDFSTATKSSPLNKQASLIRMAQNMGCAVNDVKATYMKGLSEQSMDHNEYQEVLKIFKKRKYEESVRYKIDPEDTISAFMEVWTKEYFESMNSRNNSQVLNADQNFISDLVQEIAYSQDPAEKYRIMAINKLYKENDVHAAMKLIEIGLEVRDIQKEASFYELRAECYESLSNSEKALLNFQLAYNSRLKNQPENYYALYSVLEKLSKIYEKLGIQKTALAYRDLSQA